MIKEFKDLLSNKDDLDILFKQPIKERKYPSLKVFNKNMFHEIDALYLPYSQHNQSNKSPYKYLLTVIDVHNGLCDARPLKTNSMNEIIENLDNIYTKSKYLERPNTLQGDNQFNNKQFRDFCNGYVRGRFNKRLKKIHLKISIPYRHRQQAHIERLNQTIGQMIFLYQTNKEIETNKQYTEWHEHIRTIIDFINNYKLKDLNKNYEKEIKIDNDFVFNKKTKYTIREGTKVKILLDTPQNIFGNKLSGKHRKSDIYWSTDDYIVLNCIMLPGNPPLYKVKNLKTGEIPNALYTNEQLQII